MKERHVRRLIVGLVVSAVVSVWYVILSLDLTEVTGSRHGPPPVLAAVPPDPLGSLSASSTTKPNFVLHVGPPKTATTSIQCGLDLLSADLAREDSYFFVGKRCPRFSGTMGNGEGGIPGHHLMMGLIDANPHSRGFEKLKERMDYHRARGNNMIFSIEAMSNHLEDRPETWKMFLSLFEGWNVRIVVAYRHYFDWIRSMYFQQHIGKKYREKWPDQQGLAHPSFHKFLAYHLERWEKRDPSNDGHSWGQHLSLYAMEYFANHFDDVQIFDLHQGGDVLTNFICQMLPNAPNMCRRLQNNTFVDTGVKRESHSFDADRLAMAAYQLGLFNHSIGRTAAVKTIRAELEKTGDLMIAQNLVCLNDALASRFLNASLWFEEKVALSSSQGNAASSIGFHRTISDHVEAFRSANRSGKFCEINTDVVLEMPHWKNFLSSMKATSN
jgi:hypothetical protein